MLLNPLDRTVTAPAKINLSLRVRGRRDDGYHELDSIFVPVAVFDRLRIRCTPGPTLSVGCSCPNNPELDGHDNLAARAARLLLERVGVTGSVELVLHKAIWQAAGLGGGSSDAAAVLVALNEALGNQRLDAPALARLALELGADVPFFLDPRPARAQGIGERLTPVTGLPPLALVLANPGVPLGTVEVYRGLGLEPGTRLTPPPQPERIEPSLAAVAALMINDLEPVATALCPQVGELKARLLASGAVAASMSGSGATVFGLFEDDAAAARGADNIRNISGAYAVSTTSGCGLTGAP